MSTRKLTYRQSSPVRQEVELDGKDISHLVRSVSIDAEAGHFPTVRLELAVFEMEFATGETRIHVAPGTADLLVDLGWTPPAEATR